MAKLNPATFARPQNDKVSRGLSDKPTRHAFPLPLKLKRSPRSASGPLVHPRAKPTLVQRSWLVRGLSQAGSKLPLFDHLGQRIGNRTIQSCINQGWAEPWFENPLKPDWLVCKLTEEGRRMLGVTGRERD